MKKSITKLVIIILVIALATIISLFGLQINLFGWSVSYPSALDENYGIRQGLDLVGGSAITYEAQTDAPTQEEMESVKNVLRNRLDSLGYSEATAIRQGDKKVRVEIPTISDPQQAVETLGKTAQLFFKDADGNVVLEGSDVKSAAARFGPTSETGGNQHYVELRLEESGVSKFAEATGLAATRSAESKNYIAITLDEDVISQPRVSAAINSDSCIISGGFANSQETGELAALINSGNLPFSIKDVELRNIGPTLGEDALNSSLLAAGIGMMLILIFMLVMYRLPGLMADIALIFYVGIVTFILSFFRINLSLAGIAGIILSIGMAVDANVIIFSRMKEELATGKTVKAALESGFDRAFTAILDGNITTLIAAVVLYIYSTGSIQGFAITLGIGTIVSMFTALVVTKSLLNLMIDLKIRNPKLYGLGIKGRD